MGLLSAAGALCYAELATRFPRAGGGYVFLREAFGPAAAFVYGWMSLLVIDPGLTAALAIGLSQYLLALVDAPASWGPAVAMATIASFGAVTLMGIGASAALMTWTAAAKLLAVGALVTATLLRQEPPALDPAAAAARCRAARRRRRGCLGDRGVLRVRRLVGTGPDGRRGGGAAKDDAARAARRHRARHLDLRGRDTGLHARGRRRNAGERRSVRGRDRNLALRSLGINGVDRDRGRGGGGQPGRDDARGAAALSGHGARRALSARAGPVRSPRGGPRHG